MRITGGRWRSRALEAPRGTTTRPTSDRVREALFSMLVASGHLANEDGPQPDGPAVLDLYAGSGALSFEALSRGAAKAVLVEHGRDAAVAIQKNTRALEATTHVRLLTTKVDRALETLREESFGIVFLDPPYADVKKEPFAEVLARAAALLAAPGILVLEHASADAPPEIPSLTLDRSRRYGDTTLTFYLREAP